MPGGSLLSACGQAADADAEDTGFQGLGNSRGYIGAI